MRRFRGKLAKSIDPTILNFEFLLLVKQNQPVELHAFEIIENEKSTYQVTDNGVTKQLVCERTVFKAEDLCYLSL